MSPTAFELTPGPLGATLVFAPPGPGRPRLARVELDVTGTRRGSAAPPLDASSPAGQVTEGMTP